MNMIKVLKMIIFYLYILFAIFIIGMFTYFLYNVLFDPLSLFCYLNVVIITLLPIIITYLNKKRSPYNVKCPKCKKRIKYPYNECYYCNWTPTKVQKIFQNRMRKKYRKINKKLFNYLEKGFYSSNIENYHWRRYRFWKNLPLYIIITIGMSILVLSFFAFRYIIYYYSLIDMIFHMAPIYLFFLLIILTSFSLSIIFQSNRDIEIWNKYNYRIYIRNNMIRISWNSNRRRIVNNIPIDYISSIERYYANMNKMKLFNLKKINENFLFCPIIEDKKILKVNLDRKININKWGSINYFPINSIIKKKSQNILIDVDIKLWKYFFSDLKKYNKRINIKKIRD